MSSSETQTATNRFRFLADAVAWRYRAQGRMVQWMVRGHVLHDSGYRELLAANCLPTEGVVLELGCRRGVFLTLLVCAQALGMAGGRRGVPLRLVGIEARTELAESARQALDGKADIRDGDPRSEALPVCQTAVLLDVLLYLAPEEQEGLLARLATALEEGGLLIVREVDAGAFWRRAALRLGAGVFGLFCGEARQRLYPRSAVEWTNRLEALGFQVERLSSRRCPGVSSALLLARKSGDSL